MECPRCNWTPLDKNHISPQQEYPMPNRESSQRTSPRVHRPQLTRLHSMGNLGRHIQNHRSPKEGGLHRDTAVATTVVSGQRVTNQYHGTRADHRGCAMRPTPHDHANQPSREHRCGVYTEQCTTYPTNTFHYVHCHGTCRSLYFEKLTVTPGVSRVALAVVADRPRAVAPTRVTTWSY